MFVHLWCRLSYIRIKYLTICAAVQYHTGIFINLILIVSSYLCVLGLSAVRLRSRYEVTNQHRCLVDRDSQSVSGWSTTYLLIRHINSNSARVLRSTADEHFVDAVQKRIQQAREPSNRYGLSHGLTDWK